MDPKNFGSNKILVLKKFVGGGGQNFGVKLLGLYEAYIPNLGLLPSLEPSEKFSVVVVGGGG